MSYLGDNNQEEKVLAPIRGFSWMLIGGQETFLFAGLICLSWSSSSILFYALEASFFLIVAAAIQILFVIWLFGPHSLLRDRFLASFRLLPSWEGILSRVVAAQSLLAAFALLVVIFGALIKVLAFPEYWWSVGLRFIAISETLSILFPLVLKALTVSEKHLRKRKHFLVMWSIFMLCWTAGSLLDFEQHISPPKMIVIGTFLALLAVLPIYWMYFSRPFHLTEA